MLTRQQLNVFAWHLGKMQHRSDIFTKAIPFFMALGILVGGGIILQDTTKDVNGAAGFTTFGYLQFQDSEAERSQTIRAWQEEKRRRRKAKEEIQNTPKKKVVGPIIVL